MERKLYLLILICSLICTSCFKDEPLNEECDIEEAYLHVADAKEMFYNATDTLVKVPFSSSSIIFTVRRTADLTALAPKFKLTEGATIEPANGSVHDFSQPVTYTVTSQDKAWSRKYTVEFRRQTRMVSDVFKMDFEHYRLDKEYGKFYTWYEIDADGNEQEWWGTGNPGFRLSMGSAAPEDYPSAMISNGYEGAGVKLVTRSTGSFGALVGRRIAAGNLFLGSFDMTKALTNTLKATRFGVTFNRKPLKISGFYQYTPGATYQDPGGKVVEGKIDEGDIYAVFFRNHDVGGEEVVLFGDDAMTSPQIVALARISSLKPVSEWSPFEAEFVYRDDVDFDMLEGNKYSLTVVFSSSIGGAAFEGAVGSTLMIDKVQIECEKEE